MKTQLNSKCKDRRWKASFLSESPSFVLTVKFYTGILEGPHDLLCVETIGISPDKFDDPACELDDIIYEYSREYDADFFTLSEISVCANCELLEGESIADALKIIDRVIEGFRASTLSTEG